MKNIFKILLQNPYYCCWKTILYCLTAFFLILGCFVLIVGTILLFDIGGKILLLQVSSRNYMGAALFFFGYYMILMSVFGFIAIITDNESYLSLYTMAFICLCIGDLIVAIWGLSLGSKNEDDNGGRNEQRAMDAEEQSSNYESLSNIVDAVLRSEHFKPNHDEIYSIGSIALWIFIIRILTVIAICYVSQAETGSYFDEVDENYDTCG